ncbi:MAG: ComEC/Rec2 family competence protein [Acidobacteria bacterium]|nr:ComEC/Rec2 family competence protein [Acidobacteriota bacterium]
MRHLPLAVPAALVVGLVVGARGLSPGAVVPTAVLAMLAVVASVGGLVAARASRRRAQPRAMASVLSCLCAAAFLGGGAWAAARVRATDPPPVHRFGDAAGTVTVTTLPATTARGTRMRVQVQALDGPGTAPAGTGLLLELPEGVAPPQVGQVVRVAGTVSPASHAGSPDWWVAWLRRERISARLRADAWQPVGWRGGPAGARDALRRWAQRNVAAGLSGDREAMVRGMALGGGNGLSDDASTSMRDAGLWHLLAVSGQNVAVIGIGVVAALGALGVARTRRVVMAGSAMLAYCLACDGGASVLRAGIMGAIGVAADLRGGRRAPWNALLVALAAMLALDPLAIGDPGLQLSFAAVAGLFAIAPPVGEWLRGLMPARAADLMAQSAGAGLATAPVLALGFGSISVVGLIANLIAVPVAGPVVVAAMLGVAGNALWHPLGVMLAWVAAVGAGIILWVAGVAAAIPGAVQEVPPWGAVPLLMLAVAPPLLWWWLRRVPPRIAHPGAGPDAAAPVRPRAVVRTGGRLVVGVVSLVALAWLLTPLLPGCEPLNLPAGPAVRMLDVGQGSAVALRSGNAIDVLVDTGPPGEPAPVVRALERMDASGIGVLVISHGADDHAGGAIDLLARTRVGRVVLPIPDADAPLVRRIAREARDAGVGVDWAEVGMDIRSGAWDAIVIGPGRDVPTGVDANQRCLVVSARADGLTALVPGDAESPSLAGLPLAPVDVLQVPHHGSEDPGLPGVLGRLRPSVALVSAGEGNGYGHPRAGPLRALADAGADLARTDHDGDIDVRSSDGGIIVARG